MAYCKLRVYRGPEDKLQNATEYPNAKSCTTVPVGEVLSLLAHAVDSQRAWLDDFEDDDMTISSDLYEVLMAYAHFQRPVA